MFVHLNGASHFWHFNRTFISINNFISRFQDSKFYSAQVLSLSQFLAWMYLERALGKIVKLEKFKLERSFQLNDLPFIACMPNFWLNDPWYLSMHITDYIIWTQMINCTVWHFIRHPEITLLKIRRSVYWFVFRWKFSLIWSTYYSKVQLYFLSVNYKLLQD